MKKFDHIWIEAVLYVPCWNSSDNGIGWNVFGDECSAGDNGSISDVYAVHYRYAGAEPNIISYFYRQVFYYFCFLNEPKAP